MDLNRGSSLCCRWRYFEKGGEIPGGLSRERWLTCVPRDPVINGGRRAGRCGAGSFPTGGAWTIVSMTRNLRNEQNWRLEAIHENKVSTRTRDNSLEHETLLPIWVSWRTGDEETATQILCIKGWYLRQFLHHVYANYYDHWSMAMFLQCAGFSHYAKVLFIRLGKRAVSWV